MRDFRKVLFVCVLAIFPLAFVSAQKTVRVGYYNNDGVFHSGFSDAERKSGYGYEFYQEVAKYTDWVYEYVYGTYDEIFQMLYNAEVDIVAGVTKTDERASLVLFPDYPMTSQSYYIFAPMGMAFSDDMAAVLNGSRIGVKADSYMTEMLLNFSKTHGFSCEIVPYTTLEERIDAFHKGNIDFVLTVETDRMENFTPLYHLGSWDMYFAVSKLRPDLLVELNDALSRLFTVNPYFISNLTDTYFNVMAGGSELTDTEKLALYEMKYLRFGFVSTSMPISSVDANGNVYGLAKNLAETLEDFLGIEVVPVPFSAALEMQDALLNHEIDVAFPVYHDLWLGEQNGYKQTTPFISHRVMLLYKGEYRANLLTKIGISRASIGQRSYIETHYPNAEIVEFDSREDYFKAVMNGDVSCSVGNESILQRFMRENPEYRDLNIVYLPHTADYCMAVNVDQPMLLGTLNKALTHIDQADIVNSLIGYAYIERQFTLGDFIRQNVVVLIVILVLFVAAIILAFYRYYVNVQETQAREKKTQEAIKEAYIASTTANNAKSEFLANMSHDLRTPVNAIIGMTAIADYNIDNTERVDECLEKISEASKHLLEILNHILDMSKIESGKMGLAFTPFALNELMESVMQEIMPEAERKNVLLNLSMYRVMHKHVMSDGTRLRQVFLNILQNAVQYSHVGGKVEVSISELPSSDPKIGCYEFTFQDYGCGMSEEFQKHLFIPFMREEEDERVGKHSGTGLGLAISRNIVQMLGGDIRVQSQKGVGSKFTVTLFMEYQSQSAEERVHELFEDEDISLAEFSQTSFAGKRALLVEDNVLNAEITTEILKMADLEVELAVDGMDAMNKVLATPDYYYDIIFMDVQMPVMNGYETTAAIRSYDNEYLKTVPIITMTANAFADDISHAQSSGMNEHMAKPLKFSRLLQILNRWVASKPGKEDEPPPAEDIPGEDLYEW